jgi:hypothetical protein
MMEKAKGMVNRLKPGKGNPGAEGVKKYFQFFRNIFWNKEKSFYLCRPEREKRNRRE